MDKKQVNLINENMDILVEKTHSLERIIAKLEEKLLLNHHMVKYIMDHPDQKSRTTAFYKMIRCRGPTAFNTLIVTLRETQNEVAEDILRTLKVFTFVELHPVKENNPNPSSDVGDTSTFCKLKDLVVKIHPEKKFMELVESSPCESQTYQMRSKPRGLALIINIFKARGYDDRKGSHLDVAKVDKLFTQIGYKVITYNDLTRKEMKNNIKAFSMNKNLANVDSLVVFIMSHGRQYKDTDEVELIASDGTSLRTRWIISQFTNLNPSFVSFKNKPKLFFFQACRVEVNERDGNTQIENLRDESPPRSGTIKNTLVVYSTCTGSPSMRDIHEGAWFIGEFCSVVAQHAWENDLDTMLLAVEKAVGEKHDSYYGKQHMEVKKLGISGKIYFNPGL